MITLFENYNQDIDIYKYLKKDTDGKIKIPNFKFDYFDIFFLKNPKYYIYLRYDSLMRFCLYLKLITYDGNNATIIDYINKIRNKDKMTVEIINKIPNNNKVLSFINNKYYLNYNKHEFDDYNELKKFINIWEEILNDENIISFYDIIYKLTKKAKKSEDIVRAILNMIYGKNYNIVIPEDSEDLMGVDIWKINKETGEKQIIQVKNIPGSINMISNNIFYINNTTIDLHDYIKTKNSKLPFDYLGLYSEKDKNVLIINTKGILSIDVNRGKKYIKIKLTDWASTPEYYNNVVKFINIPSKFLDKDTSKVFY